MSQHVREKQPLVLPKTPPPLPAFVRLSRTGTIVVRMKELSLPGGTWTPSVGEIDCLTCIPLGDELVCYAVEHYSREDVQVFDTKLNRLGPQEMASLLKDETLGLVYHNSRRPEPLHLCLIKEGTPIFVLPAFEPSPEMTPVTATVSTPPKGELSLDLSSYEPSLATPAPWQPDLSLDAPPTVNGAGAQAVLLAATKLEEKGQCKEAAAELERARFQYPQLSVSRRLARLYEAAGDYRRALVEYEKEREANPHDAELLNALGNCLYLKRDWAESEKYLRASLSANPVQEEAWVNLGRTLAARGRFDESLKAFQQVMGPAEAYCNLAFVQATLGKRVEAKASYRKALELDPSNTVARNSLAELDKIDKAAPARPQEKTNELARFPRD